MIKAAAILRRRHNAASGSSPSRIVLGYDPPLPGQWRIPQCSRTNRPSERPPPEEILANHQTYQQKYTQPGVPPSVQFQAGDLVLLRPKTYRKDPFGPAWLGPYPVIRRLSESVYEISILGVPSPRHVDVLRRAPPKEPTESESSTEDDSSGEDDSPGSDSEESSPDTSDSEPAPPQRIQTKAQINFTEQAALRCARTRLDVPALGENPTLSKDSAVLDGRETQTQNRETPRLLANPSRLKRPKTISAAAEDNETKRIKPDLRDVTRPISPGQSLPEISLKPQRTIRPN